MRSARELSDKVDVHLHATRAAERTGTNGQKSASLHVTKPFAADADAVTLWERIKRSLPQPEVLEVAGRSVKGLVIPHWAAGVLLAAILGSMGFMYSRLSDQRDMLIRLDTQLQERDRHELEYRMEFKNKLNLQQLQIDNMAKNVDVVRMLLTPQQLRMLERRKDN